MLDTQSGLPIVKLNLQPGWQIGNRMVQFIQMWESHKNFKYKLLITTVFSSSLNSPSKPRPPLWGSTITLRHITLARTPLDECPARFRDHYLTIQNTDKETDIHAPGWIRTCNPSKWTAADPRLRPRGHWGRQILQKQFRQRVHETVSTVQQTTT